MATKAEAIAELTKRFESGKFNPQQAVAYQELQRRGVIPQTNLAPAPYIFQKTFDDAGVDYTTQQRLKNTGITPGTSAEFAAIHLESLKARGIPVDQGRQQAIHDIYKRQAGDSNTSDQDFFAGRQADVLARRSETVGGRFVDAAASYQENLGQTGLNILGTMLPGTAEKLGQNVSQTYGVDADSRAGTIGNVVGEVPKLVAAASTGPGGMAAIYGAQGLGGVRREVSTLRAEGQDISGLQELKTATLVGGAEAVSGYIGGRIFQNMGQVLKVASPTLRAALDKGSTGAIRTLVRRSATFSGLAFAEGGEEAVTQIITNKIRQGIKPDIALFEGMQEAFTIGAILSPLGAAGVIAGTKATPTKPGTNMLAEDVAIEQTRSTLPESTPQAVPPATAFEKRIIDETGTSSLTTEEAAEARKTGLPLPSDTAVGRMTTEERIETEALFESGVSEPTFAEEAARATRRDPDDVSPYSTFARKPGEMVSEPRTAAEAKLTGMFYEGPQARDPRKRRKGKVYPEGYDERLMVEDDVGPPETWPLQRQLERMTAMYEKAHEEARTDVLTGLGNERQYLETLDDSIKRTEATGKPFSVLMFDAANLKSVNDVYGHAGGSDYLKSIGVDLRDKGGRAPDAVVTRPGGDEFIVILPDTDKAGAAKVLAKIEAAVGSKTIVPGLSFFLAGDIATYNKGGDLKAALRKADAGIEARKRIRKQQLGEGLERSDAEAMVAQHKKRLTDDKLKADTPGPKKNKLLRFLGDSYNRLVGRPESLDPDHTPLTPAFQRRIAGAYEAMEHNPNDPKVKKAYAALNKETLDQWNFLKSKGYRFEFYEGEGQPYESAEAMTEDLRKNRHLYIFKTEEGFGSDEAFTPSDHPMMQIAPGTGGWLYNDVFRAVHDVFGHGKQGYGLDAEGEENAWRSHVSMYSPDARQAMTTETRGQSTWVAYNEQTGEANREAIAEGRAGDVVFADQKVGLLPTDLQLMPGEEALPEGATDTNSTAPIAADRPPFVVRMLRKFQDRNRPDERDQKLRSRAFRAALEVSALYRAKIARAQINANNWSKDLSDSELKDVGSAVEGVGRVDIKGDTIADVEKRLTPRGREILQEYKKAQEEARQEVNEYIEAAGREQHIALLEDYLPHFYADSKRKLRRFAKSWVQTSPNAKQRRLPTLKDAVEEGLVPITQNVAELHQRWMGINWRVATNIAYVTSMSKMIDADGDGVIMERSKAPAHYITIDHPAFAKVYGSKDKKTGKSVLWRGTAAVHPDVAPAMKSMLDKPFSGAWVSLIETLNAYSKKIALSLSMFHHNSLTESAVAMLTEIGVKGITRGIIVVGDTTKGDAALTQPHRVGVRLMQDPDFLEDMITHRVTAEPSSDVHVGKIAGDLAKLEAKWKNIPLLGQATKRVRQFNTAWDKALWAHYHSGLKAYAYHHLVQKALEADPDGNIDAMKEDIGRTINDAFGGQEWQDTIFRHPKVRQIMHWIWLAPDWTLSNLKIAGKTLRPGSKLRAKNQMKYWRNMIGALGASAIGMQSAIFYAFGDEEEGDKAFPWENEAGKTWDIDVTPLMRKMPWRDQAKLDKGQRYFIHFGKQAREILHWIENPIKTGRTKSSPAVQIAYEQLTGSKGDGFDLPFADKPFYTGLKDRAKAITGKFIPFSWQGNNFGFTLPMSMGATPWKLRQTFKRELQLYAEDSLLPFARKHPEFEYELERLVERTFDAAERNGHDGAKIFKNALSESRGRYYGFFFEALEDEDMKEAEKWAAAIMRLHAGTSEIMRSAQARGIEFSDKMYDDMDKIMEATYERLEKYQ